MQQPGVKTWEKLVEGHTMTAGAACRAWSYLRKRVTGLTPFWQRRVETAEAIHAGTHRGGGRPLRALYGLQELTRQARALLEAMVEVPPQSNEAFWPRVKMEMDDRVKRMLCQVDDFSAGDQQLINNAKQVHNDAIVYNAAHSKVSQGDTTRICNNVIESPLISAPERYVLNSLLSASPNGSRHTLGVDRSIIKDAQKAYCSQTPMQKRKRWELCMAWTKAAREEAASNTTTTASLIRSHPCNGAAQHTPSPDRRFLAPVRAMRSHASL